MLKKHLTFILSLMLALVVTTGCSTVSVQAGAPSSAIGNEGIEITNLAASSTTNQAEIEAIAVTANHGITRIQPADIATYSFDYDTDLYTLQQSVVDGVLSITVDVTHDIQNYKGKIFYLYLPKAAYDSITLNVNDPAMVEVSGINANFEVNSNGGWVDARLPDGFSGNYTLNSTNGFDNIYFPSTDNNYTLKLIMEPSAKSMPYASLPFSDYQTWQKSYTKTNGTGERTYSLNLNGGYVYVYFETVQSK